MQHSHEFSSSLEMLPRQDLQKVAKEFGIRANQKSTELIAEIRLRMSNPPFTPKTPAVLRKNLEMSSNESRHDQKQDVNTSPTPVFGRIRSPLPLSRMKEEGLDLEQCSPLGTRAESGNANRQPPMKPKAEPLRSESSSIKTHALNATMSRLSIAAARNENVTSNGSIPLTAFSLKDAMRAERERRRQSRATEAETQQWEKVESRSKPGQFYYWNAKTQRACWEIPASPLAVRQARLSRDM